MSRSIASLDVTRYIINYGVMNGSRRWLKILRPTSTFDATLSVVSASSSPPARLVVPISQTMSRVSTTKSAVVDVHLEYQHGGSSNRSPMAPPG